MPRPPVTDAHAHILLRDTIDILQREVPHLAPRLTPIDDGSAILETADVVQNPFPRGAWDLERRLSDMARMGLDRQVVAVCPQTLLYGSDPDGALAVARIQNDAIATLCDDQPNRFSGLATAPMQAPDLAARELTRAMRDRGLGGAMIGTNIGGTNLDAPEFDPFWAAANALGAFILVHPIKVAGIDRQRDYYLKNIIGNPLETTLAAACLVFGGVIERFPGITFCMSHGGGFTPYQEGRFVHGWKVRDEPKVRLEGHPQASLDRLTYDTILHAEAPLRFLVDAVGEDRVMLGTDYPFDMGQYDMVAVLDTLGLDPARREKIASGTLERLMPGVFRKAAAE